MRQIRLFGFITERNGQLHIQGFTVDGGPPDESPEVGCLRAIIERLEREVENQLAAERRQTAG